MFTFFHRTTVQVLFLALLSQLFPLSAVAQAQASSEPALVQAEFSFYAWKSRRVFTMLGENSAAKVNPNLPELYYQSGSGWESISVTKGRISRSYKYSGPLPVSFYTSIPSETNQPKPIFTVQFPPVWKEVLVLLMPGSSGNMGALPVDRSAANLVSGTVRLYNLGDKPIIYKSMDRQQMVKPGTHDQFSIKNLEGHYLPVQIASEHEGQAQLAYSSKLSVNQDSRMLLLAYHPDKTSPNWLMRTLVIPEL
ncbi:MAG: hypothetical protein ACON39_04055 [Coraliomargaritaceae bacterium]